MKKILLSALILVSAVWQSRAEGIPAGVTIENWSVSQAGGILSVSFDMTVAPSAVMSREALVVVPIVQGPEGEIEFGRILVNGSRRARFARREQAFLSVEEYLASDDYVAALQVRRGGSDQTFHYERSVPVGPVVENAGIFVEFHRFDCCRITTEVTGNIVTFPLAAIPPRGAPPVCGKTDRVTLLAAPVEEVKERAASLQAYINFPTNKSDIIPTLGNNAAELDKIDQSISPVLRDRSMYAIKNITITGYASPEGAWQHNKTLSSNRARNFCSYLTKTYSLHDFKDIGVNAGGEDWDGLIELINSENMLYMEEILRIIDTTPDPDQRERKMKLVGNGAPYRYMFAKYYPQLRRMDMALAYVVRGLNDEEAVSLLETRPTDLSLEEYYRACRNKGMDRYEAHKAAVVHFPGDPVAIINAASAWFAEGDTARAWSYLVKVSEDPRAYNNMGIYYTEVQEYGQARRYFEMAVAAGDVEAVHNFEVLREYETASLEYEQSSARYDYPTVQ